MLALENEWDFSYSKRKFGEAHGHLEKMLIAAVLLYLGLSVAMLVVIEDWPLLKTAYFMAATVTTVGFGDVTPSTRAGKMVRVAPKRRTRDGAANVAGLA